MPWVRARLRGQRIFARALDSGELAIVSGRVEIRYKANDTRLYHASSRNLEDQEPELLPDDACNPDAEAPADAGEGSIAVAQATLKGKGKGPAGAIARDAIIAYTDGACSGNPGPAGWGAVIVDPSGAQVEGYGYLGTATNNIAELTAIKAAVLALPEQSEVVVHTDSQYAIGVLSKGWKAKANAELIAAIKGILRTRICHFVYVRGHAGVPLNERADTLAREAIRTRGVQEFRA
jgi:ribonuclease HI